MKKKSRKVVVRAPVSERVDWLSIVSQLDGLRPGEHRKVKNRTHLSLERFSLLFRSSLRSYYKEWTKETGYRFRVLQAEKDHVEVSLVREGGR